jgi:hypothetical protein
MSLSPVRGLKKPAISAGTAVDSLFRQVSFFDGRRNMASLLDIGSWFTGVVLR